MSTGTVSPGWCDSAERAVASNRSEPPTQALEKAGDHSPSTCQTSSGRVPLTPPVQLFDPLRSLQSPRPYSPTGPRKLSKDEAKQIKRLGSAILCVADYFRSTVGPLHDPNRSLTSCLAQYRDAPTDERRRRSRYRRKGCMSTLAEVSEKTSII